MLAKLMKLFLIIVTWFKKIFKSSEKKNEIIPLSVNYHFTRQCNYSCGFCFHTAKTSFVLPLDKVLKQLQYKFISRYIWALRVSTNIYKFCLLQNIFVILQAKQGISDLVRAGMKKINFSGGKIFNYLIWINILITVGVHNMHRVRNRKIIVARSGVWKLKHIWLCNF